MLLTRILLWMMIGSLVLAALIGIAMVVLPTSSQLQSRVLATCLLVGAFTIPSFACGVMIRQGRLQPMMWVSIIALAAATLIGLSFVWVGSYTWRVEEMMIRFGAAFAIVGGWGAHLAMLMLLRLRTPLGMVIRFATLSIAGILAVEGLLGIVFEPEADLYFKSILVLIILGSCGTLISPLMAVIELLRRRSSNETISSRPLVHLTCPRCGSVQDLRAGPAYCGQCNLRIEINIEEPRCVCGYQLYKLQSNTCPECGREVPLSDRWVVPSHAAAASPPMQDPPTR